jgi:hypothetical protein
MTPLRSTGTDVLPIRCPDTDACCSARPGLPPPFSHPVCRSCSGRSFAGTRPAEDFWSLPGTVVAAPPDCWRQPDGAVVQGPGTSARGVMPLG